MYSPYQAPTIWGEPLPSVAAPLQTSLRLLGLLLRPGEVIELRVTALNNKGQPEVVANGYFNDPARLARTVTACTSPVAALHFTINPVRRSLLLAADNKLRQPPGWMTVRQDVTRRACLLLRFSLGQPANLSPVDHPVAATQTQAYQCRDFLTGLGWPTPTIADNGKGTDLLYALDLPNDSASADLLNNVLHMLRQHFTDEVVTVDPATLQATYVAPLYDALAPSSAATAPRLLHLPDTLITVAASLLTALTALPPLPAATIIPVDDPLDRFVVTRGLLLSNAWTSIGDLYTAYQAACAEWGVAALHCPQFSLALQARWSLKPDRRKVQGVVTRGLWGIQLR